MPIQIHPRNQQPGGAAHSRPAAGVGAIDRRGPRLPELMVTPDTPLTPFAFWPRTPDAALLSVNPRTPSRVRANPFVAPLCPYTPVDMSTPTTPLPPKLWRLLRRVVSFWSAWVVIAPPRGVSSALSV